MSLLNLEGSNNFEKECKTLLKQEGIRFAGVLNNKGRLFAGGFKQGIKPYEEENGKLEMLYMELVLDFNMRKEFNNSFGNIKAITSQREKINLTTIPLGENLLLVSSEPAINLQCIISKSYEIFNETFQMGLVSERK